MKKLVLAAFTTLCVLSSLNVIAEGSEQLCLVTIADGNRGSKAGVDIGPAGPSQGDLFVFDQPLMNQDHVDMGTNSGYCVATKVGVYSQCQWTLTLADGAIVVAGQEAEQGESVVAVIGTTGKYSGFTGEMKSTPNGDGRSPRNLNCIAEWWRSAHLSR